MASPLPVPGREPGPGTLKPGRTYQALQRELGGRYVLQRELGRGGMGIVFLAWETALERPVALKVLPAAKAYGRFRERFFHEARIVAQLSHDHIVPIYAVDQAGPFVYYTMKYVEGESLYHRIMAQGPLSPAEAARVLRDVAFAVDCAHREGVIHRDLKPHNILLEKRTGRALVADFGIAVALTEPGPPDPGGIVGTPNYASPEQLAGLPVDGRSDVYSLGVTGYFIATGKLPFKGTAREVIEQHMFTPAPLLRVFGPHGDATLSQAVNQCLEKEPRKRFQTAGELGAALSLAPELSGDRPLPLRAFLRRLDVVSQSAPLGAVAALWALLDLGNAVQDGAWGTAARAAGVLGVVLASPMLAAFRVTRGLLKAGYSQADIIQVLRMDRERQKQELAYPNEVPPDRRAVTARRITVFGGALLGLGAVMALFIPGLPMRLVVGSMSVGAVTAALAGFAVVWRERWLNQLKYGRWLRFWDSQLGEWMAKLASPGPKPLPQEPEREALAAGPAPGSVEQLAEVAELTESCTGRIRAWLEAPASSPSPEEQELERSLQEKLELLEGMLEKFRSVDAATADPGSLTADIQAAVEVCAVVDGLIEGREWSR